MVVKLLIIHFVADFLCQSREMGKKKSSDIRWLLAHLAIQFAAFCPFTSWKFALANCAIHGIIDWNIWRGYKFMVGRRLYDGYGRAWKSEVQGKPHHSLMSDQGEWRYWEDHWFYSTIGFDQLLHAITLIKLAGYFL